MAAVSLESRKRSAGGAENIDTIFYHTEEKIGRGEKTVDQNVHDACPEGNQFKENSAPVQLENSLRHKISEWISQDLSEDHEVQKCCKAERSDHT
ncbi:unnamed protein product [Ceratitis capitata]|uniref:(Mediterranean fruit fly) hypothetical protein n=1 Tax=Ceratitis capitata TaxID=7213 RepID=A0A811VK45_CERCA|nr:unnamed protein product [Ceratitis capitata]